MKHIKLISGLIALSIAASTLLPIAVSADTNTEERKLINVSPINEDDDFPLYADIEFSESSIHFIDVDCYECEYGVDKSRLESSIILRAKENDTEFEISLCSNETDYEESFVSADSELSISGLEYDTYYEFSLNYSGLNYIGSIGMIFETCSSVYLDVNYMINEFDSEIQTYANMSYQYEKEDNDTEDYADVIVLGRTVSATVSKNYDVDYFYINLTSPQYKNTRFSNGTFKILLSTNGNTSVYLTMRLFAVRDGALKSIATGISTTNGSQFIYRNNNSEDNEFYLCITSSNTVSASKPKYYLNVNYNASTPFYSQKVSNINGMYLWNTQYLDQLTFNNGRPFITTDNLTDYDNMSYGCAIASYAMALRKMNATLNGKDFRTGYVGDLYADPFTAMLANMDNDGSSLRNFTSNTLPYNQPYELYREDLVSHFKYISKSVYSHCYWVKGESEQNIKKALDAILDKNGSLGAIITFTNSSGNPHFMYVSNYNTDANGPDYRYTVYDPSGTNFSHAKGIRFGLCVSHTREGVHKMNFTDIVGIHYINTLANDFDIKI